MKITRTKNIRTLCFHYIENVLDICQPLFIKTPVNFFHYTKCFDDGGYVSLSSSATWLEWHFIKHYYSRSILLSQSTKFQDRHHSNSSLAGRSQTVNDAWRHGMGPGIIITKANIDNHESFLFGGSMQRSSLFEFYLNHSLVFQRFVHYFKDRAAKLITHLEDNEKIHLSSINEDTITNEKPSHPAEHIDLSDITPKRYYIDDITYLTRKEVECIHWLAKGKSLQEIAMILHNSEKTIASHIEHAKQKMGCFKATKLVLMARELGFI